jgi:hypothetical protein
MIEGRSPRNAAVGSLENSSSNRTEIIDAGVAGNARDCEHAASPEGPNLPPLHAADNNRIDLRKTIPDQKRTQ